MNCTGCTQWDEATFFRHLSPLTNPVPFQVRPAHSLQMWRIMWRYLSKHGIRMDVTYSIYNPGPGLFKSDNASASLELTQQILRLDLRGYAVNHRETQPILIEIEEARIHGLKKNTWGRRRWVGDLNYPYYKFCKEKVPNHGPLYVDE